jgi:hypothetical protein
VNQEGKIGNKGNGGRDVEKYLRFQATAGSCPAHE